MSNIGASVLAALIVVVLFAPRRWAVLGMMAGVLYLTEGQEVNVFGFHLFAVRFLEIASFVRVMVRREFTFSKLNAVDRTFLLFYIYMTAVFLLRSAENQVYQIGLAVDASLCYFTFRGLIRDIDDLRWFLRSFIFLLVPYLMLVSIEGFTGSNPFAGMGVPTNLFREGRIRCIGSFRHPDLLGTLGACFLPLYIGLAYAKANRARALVGIGVCMGLVYFSNSGGPMACAAAGLIGWLLWFARGKMFLVRRGLMVFIIFCVIFMQAPIWYLPARVSSLTGGGGWHRSYLVDVAIRDLDKWWLTGMPIRETDNWFPYWVWGGGADITNQFLSFGISAGLGAVGLFILLLARSFQIIGKALKVLRSGSRECEMMLWGLGVMLFAHLVNFWGVCYFDQIYVVWFMQLAAITSLSQIYADGTWESLGRVDRAQEDVMRPRANTE